MKKCESFMVKPQDMQDGGMDVMQVNTIFNRFKSEGLGGALA